MTNITTQHIHPAMSALLAARTADEAGNPDEVAAQLRCVAEHVTRAALTLDAQRKQAPEYVVPVDPASLVDTECCQ